MCELVAKVPRTFVDVELPDRSDLAGATLDLAIDLSIVYPKEIGSRQFRYESVNVAKERSIRVGTATQASVDLWVGYVAFALGLCFAGAASAWALWRNWRIQKSARRPEVFIERIEEQDAERNRSHRDECQDDDGPSADGHG